nr:PREDICTED: rho GTPase-activating protein 40-like [Lepisosteus oculatus]
MARAPSRFPPSETNATSGREELMAKPPPSRLFRQAVITRPNVQPSLLLSNLRLRSSNQLNLRDPSCSEMSQEPWASPRDQAATDRTQPQGRPDKLSLSDFWTEVENIREGGSDTEQDSATRDSRQTEEGEQEKEWLQDAGLSTLISADSADSEGVDQAVLLSTLTRTQAAAVQRRLDTYTCSLRKRSKQPPRDVRDVFATPISQKSLPETQESLSELLTPEENMESLVKTPPAGVRKESQRRAARDEIFITDVAYCEQAVIMLKQAKLPWNSNLQKKDDGTLPQKVVCPRCRLGVTHIQDLSPQDMKKVRQLALIDMTALCDLLELDLKRHKTGKRKIPESCLFGVPLATLLENDLRIKLNISIPLILQELLSFLERKGLDSEGILRVPGSQTRIKALQKKLESTFYSQEFSWEEVSPNDAAALLKRFIRELPAPLLTAEHLNTFIAVQNIPDLKQKLHVLNLLIVLLPEPNRSTLKVSGSGVPKRSLHWNARSRRYDLIPLRAICREFLQTRMTKDIYSSTASGQTSGLTLGFSPQIPNFLMSQVRKLNENSSRRYQFYDKRIRSLLRKIHTDSRDKPDKNSTEPSRTVKIQVGEVFSSSMEVSLNVDSRAADLLAQFHHDLRSSDKGRNLLRRNGSIVYPDCAIYEVGGNIGEHCLDPEAYLLDLYNTNPSGEWVIRQKQGSSKGL